MERKDFMSAGNKEKLGNAPRTHENCRDKTGVNRPGKTAHERHMNPHRESERASRQWQRAVDSGKHEGRFIHK